jgi:hypothetical protein
MASALITTRHTKTGPRYVVRWRLGGRAYPIVHGGSFRTMKEARARRDLVAGELAAGRNPALLLEALRAQPTPAPTITLREWGERFLTARIDIDENTKKNYRSAINVICKTFGDRDPATITAPDVAEWIATMAETKKPGTLGQYLIALRLLLDHVGVEPNPARDPRVKLPKRVRDEPTPPPGENVIAIIGAIKDPLRRLLFLTLEQGALRLGEAISRCGGATSTAPGCGCGYLAARRNATRPAGCTCPSG